MISPEATGGIGTNYEGASIAAYLSALLAQENAPGVPGVVTGISVQQAAAGRPLDDIVIHWRDDLGRTGTLDLQLKHHLTISAGATNSNFATIVQDVWTTMHLPEFHNGRFSGNGARLMCEDDALLIRFRDRIQILYEVPLREFQNELGKVRQHERRVIETTPNGSVQTDSIY